MNLAQRLLPVFVLCLAAGACTTAKVGEVAAPEPGYALPASPAGPFAGLEAEIRAAHGADTSAFRLLDSNEDGLRWRLALIDSASRSIDVQYYLWYGDTAGQLLAKRLLDAADRGVRVRILVDDLNTLLVTASRVRLRDRVAAWLDAHPNVELRLFNPWSQRDIAARVGESVAEPGRVNTRMHNKALIVDNRAVILGGRNIGDEYMGLSPDFNFRDLDVLGVGPVARQASAAFDGYWNSAWVMAVEALAIDIRPDEQAQARVELVRRLGDSESLARFPLAPQSWTGDLARLPEQWSTGTSRVVADRPATGHIEQVMLGEIRDSMRQARRELLIANAYIIPTGRGIAMLQDLSARGGTAKILTNSLASHDVPAVNSHYKQWRRPILEAGAELFELRHDAAIAPLVADTPPTRADFIGLHAKAMVVDRSRVYIGSMNLDPRSAQINTEIGVFIDSPALADRLAALIERDTLPENSWRVELDGETGLRWRNDAEAVTRQPARNWWQRVEDVIFMGFPKELY